MITARFILGALVMVALPPSLLWWFIIHPFVGFWRGVGVRPTFAILIVAQILGMVALYFVHEPLMGRDLGTNPGLIALAVLSLAISIGVALTRKKQLTVRILTGVPELSSDDPGRLLTEGIYGRVRHPRYVEVMLGVLAYALFSNHLGPYILFAASLPVVHLLVLLEERELMDRFGAEYEQYRSRVPPYLPRRRTSASGS